MLFFGAGRVAQLARAVALQAIGQGSSPFAPPRSAPAPRGGAVLRGSRAAKGCRCPLAEQFTHDVGPLRDHRRKLLAVDEFGRIGAAVAHQPRDVFKGYALLRHERDETAAQLPGSPRPFTPATLTNARKSRRTLFTSSTAPVRVRNTKSVSGRLFAAASRSVSCAAR